MPPPSQQDPERAGPPEAEVRAWLAQYGPALRRYFQKKVSASEAEDLVQTVFLNMQVRGSTDAIDNIEGYLFRTAANVLRRRLGRDAWDFGGLDSAPEPADEVSPERTLIGRQEVERVVAALRDLPPRTREAFLLHRFEEMTYDSIARAMGISANSVAKLIKRALKRLGAAR